MAFNDPKPPKLTMTSTIDQPATANPFPLMRLPPEVRRRIYHQYFQPLPITDRYGWDISPPRMIIYKNIVSGCPCLPIETRKTGSDVDLALAFTSKTVKDEVLAAWFESQTFHITCGCELSE